MNNSANMKRGNRNLMELTFEASLGNHKFGKAEIQCLNELQQREILATTRFYDVFRHKSNPYHSGRFGKCPVESKLKELERKVQNYLKTNSNEQYDYMNCILRCMTRHKVRSCFVAELESLLIEASETVMECCVTMQVKSIFVETLYKSENLDEQSIKEISSEIKNTHTPYKVKGIILMKTLDKEIFDLKEKIKQEKSRNRFVGCFQSLKTMFRGKKSLCDMTTSERALEYKLQDRSRLDRWYRY